MDTKLTFHGDSRFVEQHKSVFFIGGLIFAGFFFLGLTLWSPASLFQHGSFGEKFLTELSIASFVGAAAAMFLSLPDVRHHLAFTLAVLFSEGKIASLLSPAAQKTLHEELSRYRLHSKILTVEKSLFSHLTKVTDQCLQTVHIHRFSQDTTLSPYPGKPNFLLSRVVRNFVVKADHLSPPTPFDFRLRHEINISPCPDMTGEEFVKDFYAQFGERVFTRKDIKIERKEEENGEPPSLRLAFTQSIELDGEIDLGVTIRYEVAQSKEENVEIALARYPTLGFLVLLHSSDDFEYDCCWFTNWSPDSDRLPGKGMVTVSRKGMVTERKTWVLPGEGVAIYWMPIKSDKV